MAIAELFSGLTPVADAPAAARQDEKRIREIGPDNAPTVPTAKADAGTATADAVDDGGDWAERAAIVEHDGGAPRAWAEGVATLERSGPPPQFTPAEWAQVVHDAGVFLDEWAGQALALGWTAYDIFGCNRRAPRARLDALGLVALLRGGRVVALTADTARIQHKTGAVHTYRRRVDVEARDSLLQEVCDNG